MFDHYPDIKNMFVSILFLIHQMIVIAKYDYDPLETIDIPLKRGKEYSVLNNSRDYWWKVRDRHG